MIIKRFIYKKKTVYILNVFFFTQNLVLGWFFVTIQFSFQMLASFARVKVKFLRVQFSYTIARKVIQARA